MTDKEQLEKVRDEIKNVLYDSGCQHCLLDFECDKILAIPEIKQALELLEKKQKQPKIICLCGSTRFVDIFNEWRKRLTLEGNIIVSIELVTPQTGREDPQHSNYKVKQALDELHLRKIDLADEIFVINVNGYIGESTTREIEYAKSLGKPIKYLEE